MKRLFLYLTDQQYEGVREIAHEKRVNISELIREIVTEQYHLPVENVRQGKRYIPVVPNPNGGHSNGTGP